MGEVKLYGFWYSPYSKKVEIALKIKGVEYEYIEEDRDNKSEQLLKYNPIHRKTPVLVHDGKPLAESLLIMEYVDETWKGNPILPSDPYDRAQARFLGKLIDDNFDKLIPKVREAVMDQYQGENLAGEADELLKILENEIKGKKFFGGDEIGILDIFGVIVAFWFPILQEVAGKELIIQEKYPSISAWCDRLLAYDVIKEVLPAKEKVIEFLRARFTATRPN